MATVLIRDEKPIGTLAGQSVLDGLPGRITLGHLIRNGWTLRFTNRDLREVARAWRTASNSSVELWSPAPGPAWQGMYRRRRIRFGG